MIVALISVEDADEASAELAKLADARVGNPKSAEHLRNVALALLALTNDTDAIVTEPVYMTNLRDK